MAARHYRFLEPDTLAAAPAPEEEPAHPQAGRLPRAGEGQFPRAAYWQPAQSLGLVMAGAVALRGGRIAVELAARMF